MNAIIFGYNGQDGIYLKELLLENSIEVVTVSRKNADIICNIQDYNSVEKIIREKNPDFIFHFAANSTVSHSALFENNDAISNGTLNILESVFKNKLTSKVFISGSAMQFSNNGTPINELTPFEPSSPYSVARIHSVYLARYYRNYCGLKTYVGYFFNHDSPMRTERHFNQKIVQAVLRIANGSKEKPDLGDLSIKKEFNFAGDFMKAVWCLVNQEDVHEVVIGSGVTNSLQDWVEYCFKKKGLNWKDYITGEQSFKNDYQCLVSDPSLLMSLGWKPSFDIAGLADLMLESK
ncbi:MAG: GDP-mannose 4,6-dehydratase [Bacteriovorax sp.]|nr:GDP-mannose 4,6-dehydratase [Bacteriovorax sp.]